jgi:hypothetical protein
MKTGNNSDVLRPGLSPLTYEKRCVLSIPKSQLRVKKYFLWENNIAFFMTDIKFHREMVTL